MSPSDLLILDRAAIGYPERTVLSPVTLTLRRGCFTALLGANGSGKSTLLRTLLGLIPPLSGTLTLVPIDQRAPRLGYVPQRDTLDPLFLFTSLEVVLQAACARVKPGRRLGATEKDWARACLQRAGAGDLERQLYARLSGGQKQRVLVARALAVRPDLLLLDEPTAGVDPAATQAILQLLQKLHDEEQVGILLVTHEWGPLRSLVKEVIWLRQGTIEQGPVDQLLARDKIDQMLDSFL